MSSNSGAFESVTAPRREQGRGTAVLSELFAENVDAVFGFVFARCGSRQLAEEITSDAFAEAARAFANGSGGGIRRPWLFHVARLRLIDHWRRAERQRRIVDRFMVMERPTLEMQPQSDEHGVLAAMDSLPERQRAVLALRYLDEYSVSETAEALGLSYRATESLLARGRRSLAAAYEEMSK